MAMGFASLNPSYQAGLAIAMRNRLIVLALFLVLVALVVAWVSAGNEEFAHAARVFLRTLFRLL